MAYGIGHEFPNVHGGYPDVCELLYLYKRLTEEYQELLNTITDTQQQLKDYMDNVNTLIPGWISAEMAKYIAELNQLKTDVTNQLRENQQAVQQFLDEYNEKVSVQLSNNLAAVNARIDKNEEWVMSQLLASEQHTQELIRRFTESFEQAVNAQNQYVAEQLAAWTAKNELLFSQITENDKLQFSMIAALDNQLKLIESTVTNHIADVQKMLNDYNTVMRLWYYAHRYEDKKWLSEEIAKVHEALDNMPESKLPVFNYFRNKQTGINEWVDDVYLLALPIGGYSALDWSRATWLSAEEFNMSNITAIEFYVDGKRKLDDDRWKYYTFSPISGEYVWIGRALQEVANALNPDAVTAKTYDDSNITAADYDGKNITAEQYRKGVY